MPKQKELAEKISLKLGIDYQNLFVDSKERATKNGTI